jgi:hypothetical protein
VSILDSTFEKKKVELLNLLSLIEDLVFIINTSDEFGNAVQ